jgi:succinate-acetate transporter protein
MKNTVTGTSELTGRATGPPTVATEMGRAAATEMTVADPAPLGLAAFGITTLVLSVINAGWLDASATIGVISLAIAFGGASQFMAGMWAFRRGNTFAATAFTSYGAFWISYALLVTLYAPQIKDKAILGSFLGLYLLGWAIFTAYMTIASFAGARAVTVVFVLLTLTFAVLSWGEYATSTTIHNWGGYIGLLTAVAALYASFADVLNASFKRVLLPTGAP